MNHISNIKPFKAFSVPFECEYASAIAMVEKYPFLRIGFYYEYGGTTGEFCIIWDNIGIRIKAYHDSWDALYRMPELLEFMSEIGRTSKKPSIHDFCERLKELGYRDITKRESD